MEHKSSKNSSSGSEKVGGGKPKAVRRAVVMADDFIAKEDATPGKDWYNIWIESQKDFFSKATANATETASPTIQLLGIKGPKNQDLANARETLISLIRTGITKQSFDRLTGITGIAVPELAGLIHISDRTLRRYAPDQELSQEQGERIVALANLYARGEQVFEAMDRFRNWMDREQVAFGDKSPRSYLDTSIGIDMIQDELGRIEHGIFA